MPDLLFIKKELHREMILDNSIQDLGGNCSTQMSDLILFQHDPYFDELGEMDSQVVLSHKELNLVVKLRQHPILPAIQSALQPLHSNLDANISTSKFVDLQPPTTIGLLATTKNILEFVVSDEDEESFNVVVIPEVQGHVPLPELSELLKAAKATGKLLNHYVDFVKHHSEPLHTFYRLTSVRLKRLSTSTDS
ncbi:uncharacterized protein LOC124323945 [Daphnia pulicaria]|uniref:uncharacterized protein LOC124323945 n=1 Tax=Daphnia pulicaria TaxID=35523 RepID=UPI001EEBFD1F|nr:uncharacterized protein LOC124323945 [Daphnia pulicaria]